MKPSWTICLLLTIFFFTTINAQDFLSKLDKEYLSWDIKRTQKIIESWREKGRIGGFFDTRVLSTDKSYNYKLRATLLSPEAIRGAARMEQLRNSLSESETKQLVSNAEKLNLLVIIIEIDPREGSGVIPNDWRALLKPVGVNATNNKTIRGIKNQNLRNYVALQGVGKRDYDYDIFWVAFSLTDDSGNALWEEIPDELELTVGIYGKEGKVNWKITDALKTQISKLLKK